MTNLQEAKLAREAEICYVTIAMVTDYDCWHPDHDAVTVTDIIGNLTKNAENAAKLITIAVRDMPAQRACKCGSALAHALITDRKANPGEHAQEAGAAGWQVPVTSFSIAACAARLDRRNLLDRALAVDEGRALLSIVVERLGDLFEPRLCEIYEELFTQVIGRVCPELRPRIRRRAIVRRAGNSRPRICAIASHARRRCCGHQRYARRREDADIQTLKSSSWDRRKSFELFEADPRIRHFPAPYARGRNAAATGCGLGQSAARRRHRDRSRLAAQPTRLDLGV